MNDTRDNLFMLPRTPNSDRSEIYSSTRSGSFSTTGSSINTPVTGHTKPSNNSSCSIGGINDGKTRYKTSNTSGNISSVSSGDKSDETNCINLSTKAKDAQMASVSHETGYNINSGYEDGTQPSCSYRTSTSTRRRNRTLGNRNSTSSSTTTSNTSCSSDNITKLGSSTSTSYTSGSISASTTSGSSSCSSTSNSEENNIVNRRSSSCSERELKNLQDAWSESVSPFRTRSQSEGTTPGRQTRRQINFSPDESSASCYPPSSPSIAKSTSSGLLSITEPETSEASPSSSVTQGEQTPKVTGPDNRDFHSNTQESNSEYSPEHLSVTPVSPVSSVPPQTNCDVTTPKGFSFGTLSSGSSLPSDVTTSASAATSNTIASTKSIKNVSVLSNRNECTSSEMDTNSCISEISVFNNVGDVCQNEEMSLSARSNLSASRFNTDSENSSDSTYLNKTNPAPNPVSTHYLRSRRVSGGVQATTSKAASCDGICSDNCMSKDFTSDSVSRKLQIVETTHSTATSSLPDKRTRSRSKSADVTDTAEFKHNGSHGDDTTPKKPTLSKLTTILTSEHDYFKKDSSLMTADSPVYSCAKSTGHKSDKTYTIYTIDSSANTDSGQEYLIPASNCVEQKLSMARSDNALSGIPSDMEDKFYGSPLPSSLQNDSDDYVENNFPLSVTKIPSVYAKGGSSSNTSDEGKDLGFDLNDFVIRRRRLRSESTKDELWEGFPAITPFRKHLSKFKSDDGCVIRDDNDNDGELGGDECVPQLKSSSGYSLKGSSSSTTDLISEIDSILSDTQSSYQHLITSSIDDVTQFHEETWDNQKHNGNSCLNLAQQMIDKDLNCNTDESLDTAANFSSDSLSELPSQCDIHNKGKSESEVSVKDYLCQVTGKLEKTPSDISTTPVASRPESIWWSEGSEDWATPEDNPLGISPIVKSSSDDSSKLHVNSSEISRKKYDSEIYDCLEDSCAAVDGSIFREITARNRKQGYLRNEPAGENDTEHLNTSNKGCKTLQTTTDLSSSSATKIPTATEDSDGDPHLGPFRIRESGENVDAQEMEGNVPTNLASPTPSKSDTSSSSEFLLWSKKKDKRKLSFPKIVLRKCRETRQHSSLKSKDSTPEEKKSSCRRKSKESVSSDDSPTLKRSARLMRRVDANSSGQSSRSTDFVYTSLKREDSRPKSSSQVSSHDANSSGRRPKCNREARNSEVDSRADVASKQENVNNQTKQTRPNKDCNSDQIPQTSNAETKTRKGVLKRHGGASDERILPKLYQSPVHNIFGIRRRKGPVIDEELLTNPVIDKHACVLWSSEHRRHFQLTHPEATTSELDEMLRNQWSRELTAQEKMKYFTRARDAVRDEDKHAQRSSRDSKRSGRTGHEKKSKDDEMSGLERFTRLKIKRQKDLLTKWLHFFQKVLSRKEYAEFIEDVKQGILEAEARDKPNKSRGLTSKIFSHKKLLFLKMNKLKHHVMKQYFHRLQRQKELHKLAFDILVRRLIEGKPCAFIKGCRSRVLTTILQDLKELEYSDSVAVLGYPISSKSFTSLYKEIVETVDSSLFKDESTERGHPGNAETAKEIGIESPNVRKAEGDCDTSEQGPSNYQSPEETTSNASGSGKSNVSSSCLRTVGCEWYDKQVNPNVMDRFLDDLNKLPRLPVLQHSTLDTMFLPPPVWVPRSAPPPPLTLKTMPTYHRASVPGWMSTGIRYNFTSRTSGPGQVARDIQGTSGHGCFLRIPGSNRPIDLTPRMPASPLPARGVSVVPRGTHFPATSTIPKCYQPTRDVMYAEARDAFNRSYTGTTDPCCEMDSPACVLSTWIAADKTNMQ